MKNIITITRQFGSLGRPIAKDVSRVLGMKYYDRDIIDIAARNLGMNVDELLQYEDKALTAYDKMMHPLGFGDAATRERLYKMEKSVILELATNDNCVFVGRCVDYLLKDVKNVLSIYIYAPYEARLRNCVETLKLSDFEAKKYIKGVDRARNDFYKHYGGADYDQFKYRHLMLDSSAFGDELCVETICEIAKRKFGIESK